MTDASVSLTCYPGSCHCRAVTFEVDLPTPCEVVHCNCSICSMNGLIHVIVPASRFRVTSGEAYLTEYRFNSQQARHFFCRVCGIEPYYIPRSNPDGVDVNLRCLETPPQEIEERHFDGQNWEVHAAELAHLSKE